MNRYNVYFNDDRFVTIYADSYTLLEGPADMLCFVKGVDTVAVFRKWVWFEKDSR